MKKFFTILLSALLVFSLAACNNAGNNAGNENGGNTGSDDNTSTPSSAIESPLELLNTIWASYGDDEKFSVAGGDTSEENITTDAPGKYNVADANSLDSRLCFPAAHADKIDDAASMIHMFNANTFTCGAFHVKNAADLTEVTKALEENILARHWMCGFPDKFVILTVDDYIVSCFGHTELVDTFKEKVIAAYPAELVCDKPVM